MFVLCVLYSEGKKPGQVRIKYRERKKKKSHRWHECLTLVSVVCCQVKVSATGRSLVQSSPTDCGVSLCVTYIPQE
jgi:hypothetical protein